MFTLHGIVGPWNESRWFQESAEWRRWSKEHWRVARQMLTDSRAPILLRQLLRLRTLSNTTLSIRKCSFYHFLTPKQLVSANINVWHLRRIGMFTDIIRTSHRFCTIKFYGFYICRRSIRNDLRKLFIGYSGHKNITQGNNVFVN